MPDDSKRKQVLGLIVWLLIAFSAAAVGGAASVNSPEFYRQLDRPTWAPPASAFGPVWTVLYALLAASVIAIRRRSPASERGPIYFLYGSNLALNLAWTLIFFRGRSPLAAGVEIVVLEGTCVALIVRAWPASRLAALALVPYAAWVAFATALTWSIAARNRWTCRSLVGAHRRRA